ncbi:methyltransferase domain-containing protein [Desulfovibrio sp. OttesenSCG-928-A18]|nr:methyltransferase domain-containing protein [Desulfovibrio sp. OttesenSCG-928-A18]
MPRFLHAACGNNDKTRTTREFDQGDWEEVRMDVSEEARPDVIASLLDMPMVPDAYFDAVFTAHSLERMYPHQVGSALANIMRVLKHDGYLVVTAADIQAACALVAEDKLLEPAYDSPAGPVAPLDILYGFRPALAAGYERHACKCGFTSRALTGTLAQAGFVSLWSARNPDTFTLVSLATKAQKSEEELKDLASRHFGS